MVDGRAGQAGPRPEGTTAIPHAVASGHDGTAPVWPPGDAGWSRAAGGPRVPRSSALAEQARTPLPSPWRVALTVSQARRMVTLILSPAATTATACSLPGERVSRSIGPDTDAAAITFPPCPRTGAD